MVRGERGRCRCWVDGIHLDLVEFGRRGHIIMVAIMVVKAGGRRGYLKVSVLVEGTFFCWLSGNSQLSDSLK